MTGRNPAVLIVAAFGLWLAACSGQSPVTPSKTPETARSVSGGSEQADSSPITSTARAVPGSYNLSFFVSTNTGLEPAPSTLIVNTEELILGAHVADNSGAPAQGGLVTFQYCSYKGLPPNDITRADEAPLDACANGSATWRNLITLQLNGSGDAYMDFGIVQIPRTIGFRFRYTGQGSGIANGVSEPKDYTWVAS